MKLWDIPSHPAICVSQKYIYLDLRRNTNVAESQSRVNRVQKKNQTKGLIKERNIIVYHLLLLNNCGKKFNLWDPSKEQIYEQSIDIK